MAEFIIKNRFRRYILLSSCFIAIISVSFYGGYTNAGIFPFFKESPNQGEMVLIPAGAFIMGSSEEEIQGVTKEYGKRGDFVDYDFKKETPRRQMHVKAFYIDRYEVTNAQYKRFIDATGYKPPHHWEKGVYPAGKDNHPVINVSYDDAMAYAFWAGKRLPTEEEWEKAARGNNGQVYPWGNEFNPENVRTAEALLATYLSPRELVKYAAPVDEFKKDESPYGAYDMAGNVMEWTDSWYEKGKTRVVKGAAWVHIGPRARSASKEGARSDEISHLIGFRCAMNADKGIKKAEIEKQLYASIKN